MAMPPAGPTDPGAAGDPLAAAGATDPGADADAGGSGDTVVVTISKTADGSYMVYPGDEPEQGGDTDDMSDDDADAMGPAGEAPAGAGASTQGQPADSVGQALKLAMDILQSDKSSEGAPGNSDDQFAAGFSANQSPTPATGMASKY